VRKPPIKFGVFILILPDERAAARIEALACRVRRDCGLRAKPLVTSRFHVSLNNLGEYEDRRTAETVVLRARDAVTDVRESPFTVMFNLVQSFSGRPGDRPLVLRGDEGVVGLEKLYHSLGVALRRGGIKSPSCFTPHLTLSYGERPVEERFVEPISWIVRDFALVLSLRGETQYVFEGRWSLGA
jgi:RNA 2',3'-cyclic 3'-phosphodiesterase